LAILMADGFTEPMVNGLCQMSANDGPPGGHQPGGPGHHPAGAPGSAAAGGSMP
jgi:hypothetical protein